MERSGCVGEGRHIGQRASSYDGRWRWMTITVLDREWGPVPCRRILVVVGLHDRADFLITPTCP
jgi:hypothetical protein